jgi:prepilin-type N-terminal cleavage/methylation domain-containing protein
MRLHTRLGFSIIELLVVIAIISMLVAMLLPAVQAARESARQSHCTNNLKQLATACLAHAEQRGYLPTGGWGWGWAGEPDRGYAKDQPGGWHYNILPFLQLGELHKLGSDGTNKTYGAARAQSPVPVFSCPTRRQAVPYPFVNPDPYFNVNIARSPDPEHPTVIARSDYAACGGDMEVLTCWKGPAKLAEGDAMSEDDWAAVDGGKGSLNGVICRRSMTRFAHITDGTNSTYLLGERYLSRDYYFDGGQCSDDQGWDCGYDFDVNRWAFAKPMQDTPGYVDNGGCDAIFGSAHWGQFHMAFCDGSVRGINYGIDLTTHRRLGNRQDGEPVDRSGF